ncbi:MAG: VOC family protein [Pseudomonadota bacterium]
MTDQTTHQAALQSISPFFIVRDLKASTAFYREKLGFDVRSETPEPEPFFAIVGRGGVQIMLKEIDQQIAPLPNPQRHHWASWDAYVYVPDPDGLAAELTANGVRFSKPLANTDDSLRGFEIADADGYTLFFGRPIEPSDTEVS